MLEDLIERLEKASGSDRELDLAITLAIHPDGEIAKITAFPRGLTATEGMCWDIWHGGSVVFEKREADGRCNYNGGYPLPAYTASIDAALTLFGEHIPRGLHLYRNTGVDMGGKDWMVSSAGPVLRVSARSWPLALCIAALKSRSAQAGGRE